MRILLLAPHPLYQERGTPIATRLLLRALSERGEEVDVVTYHEGQPLGYPGVTIHRIPRLPLVRKIRPGFSVKKVVCDLFVLMKAVGLCCRTRYRVVHCIEESVFIGMVLKVVFRLPYIYDMDSSLAQQMVETYPFLRVLKRVLEGFERLAIRGAEVIVPVCEALKDLAASYGAKRIVVLQDVSLLEVDAQRRTTGLKRRLGVKGLLLVYAGNLESYQGIDLLLNSFALSRRWVEGAHLLVIGGAPTRIKRYQSYVDRLGIEQHVSFIGSKPVSELGTYLREADLLVSPRIRGRNTPMKIYSYLHAGRPVLATDLPTHTQVLNREVSMLTAPSLDAYAEGMVQLMTDERLRARLGEAGRRLAERRHSYRAFRKAVAEVYDGCERVAVSAEAGDAP